MAVTPRGSSLVMAQGENNTFESYNANTRRMEAVLRGGAKTYASTPPGSPVEGDVHLVLATGSGAWAGKDNYIAEWVNGAWVFYLPFLNDRVYLQSASSEYRYNGSAWVQYGGGTVTSVNSIAPSAGNVTLTAADVGAAANVLTFNAQSGTSYTAVSGDFNGSTQIRMSNSSANTVTLPNGIAAGKFLFIRQIGTGQTTIAASGTLSSLNNYTKIAGQHGEVTVVSTGSNNFDLVGSLGA